MPEPIVLTEQRGADGEDRFGAFRVVPEFLRSFDPQGPGIFDASSGAYNLRTTGMVPVGGLGSLASFWNESTDPFYESGTWRASVRAESGGTNVALVLRTSPDAGVAGPGYLFTTSIFGDLQLWNCDGVDCNIMNDVNVGFQPGEDWVMEAGIDQNRITAKMWREGGAIPADPQIERIDGSHPTGGFAVTAFIGSNWDEPAQVNATFDDIFFTPVPEPSGILMLFAGLVGVVVPWRRR